MPGDWTLGLDWPTCSIDHQCEKNKNLESDKDKEGNE